MDGKKASHGGGGGGGGIKHRLTQMLLRNACTISTANTTTTTTTSFVSVSNNGTNGEIREGEPPGSGTPSLSMLLQKHRSEKQARPSRPSTPRLEKSSSHRGAPVVQVSIDCGGGKRGLHGTNNQNHVPVPPVPVKGNNESKKKKKNSSSYHSSKKSSPASPSSPLTRHYYSSHETRRKKITGKPRSNEIIKKWQSNPYGFSTSSSAHSDMEPGLFSSSEGEEGETQTLFSSKSFSSDSSEVYHRTNNPKTPPPVQPNKTHNQSPKHNAKRDVHEKKHPVYSVSSKDTKVPNTGNTGNTGTGKGTSSGRAVVKRSCNPYMDFRSSMVEMIVEQKVISAKEMERLLQSYLALNATHHHPVIVRAFEDICEAIFTDE